MSRFDRVSHHYSRADQRYQSAQETNDAKGVGYHFPQDVKTSDGLVRGIFWAVVIVAGFIAACFLAAQAGLKL